MIFDFGQRVVPIRILSVGKKRSPGVQLIVDEYIRKLNHYCTVDDVQIRSNPRNARYIYICMALLFYFIFSFNFFEVNFCFILRIKYYTDLFIYVLVFLCYIGVIMDTQVHINRLFLLKQQRQPKSWVRL